MISIALHDMLLGLFFHQLDFFNRSGLPVFQEADIRVIVGIQINKLYPFDFAIVSD